MLRPSIKLVSTVLVLSTLLAPRFAFSADSDDSSGSSSVRSCDDLLGGGNLTPNHLIKHYWLPNYNEGQISQFDLFPTELDRKFDGDVSVPGWNEIRRSIGQSASFLLQAYPEYTIVFLQGKMDLLYLATSMLSTDPEQVKMIDDVTKFTADGMKHEFYRNGIVREDLFTPKKPIVFVLPRGEGSPEAEYFRGHLPVATERHVLFHSIEHTTDFTPSLNALSGRSHLLKDLSFAKIARATYGTEARAARSLFNYLQSKTAKNVVKAMASFKKDKKQLNHTGKTPLVGMPGLMKVRSSAAKTFKDLDSQMSAADSHKLFNFWNPGGRAQQRWAREAELRKAGEESSQMSSSDRIERIKRYEADREKNKASEKQQKKDRAAREAREERERAERRERERAERAGLESRVEAYFAQDNAETRRAKEYLTGKFLSDIGYGPTVGVLVGNPVEKPDQKIASYVTATVAQMVKLGKIIIYDADSTYAPIVADAAGKNGVGISAHTESQAPLIVKLENPYLRLEAFKRPSKVLMDPSSITARGVTLESYDGNIMIGNEKLEGTDWKASRGSWSNAGGIGELTMVNEQEKMISKMKGYGSLFGSSSLSKPLVYNLKALASETSYRLDDAIRYAKSFERAEEIMSKDENGKHIPGGAVVFGSGSLMDDYTDLVYQTSRRLGSLGVTVATGGSGGFMEVANDGAYGAGAYSIGIPLGGGILKSEKRVASDKHSITVSASGYETRIPWLLKNRQLIVSAPGGGGTVKEIAVTLVDAGSKRSNDLHPYLVFLADSYYGKLVKYLSDQTPEAFKQSLVVVNSADEIENLVAMAAENPKIDKSELKTKSRPVARDNRTHYEEPKKFSDDRSWSDFMTSGEKKSEKPKDKSGNDTD